MSLLLLSCLFLLHTNLPDESCIRNEAIKQCPNGSMVVSSWTQTKTSDVIYFQCSEGTLN